MALLSDARLDEVLRAQNPWWASGVLPQRARHTQERRADVLLRSSRRPVLLTGPRRSGKTCALLRLVESRLRSAEHPREVAYLPLDHPLLRLVPVGPLVDRALKLCGAAGSPLVLLDGLQALPQWPERFVELLKTRPRPRFVAAAAVAPGNRDPSYDIVALPPFSFREVCALRGVPALGAPRLDLLEPRLPDRTDPVEDRLFSRILDPLLADYLVRGGFPDAVFEPDLSLGREAVREGVVARAVYQDLPAVVGVMKQADLERVLLAALLQGGRPLQVDGFADDLDLARHTVVRYLEHLERAFLLTRLKNFAAATDRSRPRLFPIDPGLSNALFDHGPGVLAAGSERRALLAAAIVAHVENAAAERGFDVAYYRDGDLDAEVVLVSPEGVVPILVADRDEAGEEQAVPAEKIMKRTGAKVAYLLSRAGPRRAEALTFFETVFHLPAAYFLYALGG